MKVSTNIASPLVSVVMCTYNGGRFLDEQIRSILEQDYLNLELIIVDDVSTDNTWSLLLQWKAKSDKIRIYKNDANLGYNKNFEKAITLAAGELIAISDQDDVWLHNKITKLVQALDNDKVILAHNRSVRLQDGRLRYKSASLHHHFYGSDTRRLFMFNQVNGHDMMFKKSLVSRALPIPAGMMYDWWLAVVATCYGSIASVDEFLVHHRIHNSNSYFTSKPQATAKPDLIDYLQIFRTLTCLNNSSQLFLQKFISLLQLQNSRKPGTFSMPLFLFYISNRNIVFGHKKRMFKQLYQFKMAFKYARLQYKGRGLTI